MIDVEQLNFTIGQRQLFTDLSFKQPKGSIGAILGPNGRGKTTLLRLLLSLQQGATGKVRINAPAAYVPQLSSSLFHYSVRTMVSLGRIRHLPWYSSPSKKDHQIVEQCLTYLELNHFADQPFNRLSGGEKQMVMIARALASEPEILILDEPTSALDLANQDNVLSVLRDLAAHRGMTILFTSHYPQHALHIADHSLLLFNNGSFLFGGSQTILTEENLAKLYQLPVAITAINDQGRQTHGVIPLFR
ncbi:ABC transporter ATP-binding protein [Providencia rettgeri]|nr:ABC transporter ATP-binding protein [Providencia rettgeri]EJD6670899.1 ABC transporter ATP-binding protein [Providencia rettgeri]ELQ1455375.1 ABC transporter ATP-binding protein [Providencia rettgeri]ELR5185811.1 ABC transporter ATP-binding protein [Providencia rettgeri]EMB0749403.1 ABC transporter ATP-binding protein [Providencia rettgeri]